MTAYNAFRQGLWELCLLVRKTIGGSSARFHLETPGKCRSIGESGPLRSCDQRVSSGPVARTIPILTKPTSAWPRFSSGRKNRKPRVGLIQRPIAANPQDEVAWYRQPGSS